MPALLPCYRPWGKRIYGRYAGNDHLELPELAYRPYGRNRAPLHGDFAGTEGYRKPLLEGLRGAAPDTGPADLWERGNGI
jgi:hypothetical protein